MAREHFAAHGAKVGGEGEIAAFVKRFRREPGPAAVDFAAAHAPAHGEHDVGMTMIGAAIAVLARGAAELRHGEKR